MSSSPYGQNADLSGLAPIPERHWSLDRALYTVVLPLVLTASCYAMYVVAAALDEKDAAEAEALARAERQALMLPLETREAYERGMSDALQGLQGTPDGQQLAQACTALGWRRLP